jgi:Nucleoside H+ symporter.
VRDGVGPDLGIYLKSSQNWNPAEIGMAAAASSIAAVIAQTPAGALIDSNLLAGFVAKNAGYNASFLMLAAIATVASAVFWFLVPETKELKAFANRKSTVAQ